MKNDAKVFYVHRNGEINGNSEPSSKLRSNGYNRTLNLRINNTLKNDDKSSTIKKAGNMILRSPSVQNFNREENVHTNIHNSLFTRNLNHRSNYSQYKLGHK